MPLGSKTLSTANNESNLIDFAIKRKLSRVNTVMLAKITEIQNEGLGNERLTVQPLVNMVKADNTAVVPPFSYSVPATRIQGGNAGIIIQYQAGDTCLVGYCSRDITSAKRTAQLSNPDSLRLFSLCDAVIISHWSNTLPSIYVKVTNDIIDIKRNNSQITLDDNETIVKYGANSVKIDNTGISIQGNTIINGTLEVNNTAKATDFIAGTVTLKTHIHPIASPGSSTETGIPTG